MSRRTETTGVPDIDFLDPEAIERPHGYFARVRDELGPVAWSERHHAWVVTGHPELDAAFRAPELSTDRIGAFSARLSGSRADALARAIELLNGWMLFHDPPEHTRLRAPFQRRFTPRAVSSLRADVETICDDLLDRMAARRGSDTVDLVEAFSHPLPAAVIAELFGVPADLRPWLTDWSARFGVVVFGATRRPDYEEVARSAGEEFHHHLGELLAQRRADPRDDLVSALARSGELDDLEVLGACSLLLFAGHDTTASLLSSATLALCDHPDQRARFAAGAVDLDRAIEELLRFEGSAKAMMRQVAEPLALGGRHLEPGEAVFLTILAANRDPRVFDAPDELRLDRSPNPHLAFGHGVHFCLGASLARLELRVALPRLFAAFPDLQPAGPPTWKPNISDRSPSTVPLRLSVA
ncbi:MAG: cytochrome P450 [Acidimicrobiales bacterium]|nr:cytochrome P450 [Acidimicrobiales bacterium]